jgi:DNA helicase-2/ATP-dependent DNA helicase PcrA
VLDRLGAAFVGSHAYCFRLLQQYVPKYKTYDMLDERRLTAFLCRVERRLDLRSLTGKQFASIKTFLANLDVVENELLEVERMAGPFGIMVSNLMACTTSTGSLRTGSSCPAPSRSWKGRTCGAGSRARFGT